MGLAEFSQPPPPPCVFAANTTPAKSSLGFLSPSNTQPVDRTGDQEGRDVIKWITMDANSEGAKDVQVW